MTEYLDPDDLMRLTDRVIDGEVKVRDAGLLSSALHRPQTVVFGGQAYPTLAEKAGALLHSLVMNHALFDGNKRLGWATTLVFCAMNGCEIDMTQDNAYLFVMSVARGELDAADIADELRVCGVVR